MSNTLDAAAIEKVTQAGELLIRAAAVLGTLTPEQQDALRMATNGALPDSIVFGLRAARTVSPQIAQSLETHPLSGCWAYRFDSGLEPATKTV